jgi:glycosyltransferase involved in cell wall biosynthesis
MTNFEGQLRVLHILSQRPGLSGSGVFFNSIVREAALRSISQYVIVAGPENASHLDVPHIGPEAFSLIQFPSVEAPFPVPGNSDVMPYPSSVFSEMTEAQIQQYLGVSRRAMEEARESFRPNVVHAHHLWLMTSLANRVFDGIPVVATAHNSELRQLVKAPHLRPFVLPGIQDLDRIFVLTSQSGKDTVEQFGVAPDRVHVTGAGFREDLFGTPEISRAQIITRLETEFGIALPRTDPDGRSPRFVTFAGRLSSSKGVAFLLEAFNKYRETAPEDVRLLLVGASGFGEDGKRLDGLVAASGRAVLHLGVMPQAAVALVFQCSDLFVLPSLFEGLPLVMLEAAACGCPCLVSSLPSIRSWVPESWIEKGYLTFIPPIATTDADRPVQTDTARFVSDIEKALGRLMAQERTYPERKELADLLKKHSWAAVFDRYLEAYRCLGS